jgi:hypothetical protein
MYENPAFYLSKWLLDDSAEGSVTDLGATDVAAVKAGHDVWYACFGGCFGDLESWLIRRSNTALFDQDAYGITNGLCVNTDVVLPH